MVRFHWEGYHLDSKKNFLTSQGRRPNIFPQRRVPGNGKCWRQRPLVKTPQHTQEREEGKEEKKKALRGHWENSYFCALSSGEGLPSPS